MIRIVIVDDEAISLQSMGRFIEHIRSDVSVEGMFENMDSAVRFLAENEVDMVITDIKMPNGSGIELARHIQTNYPNIKIVFLSAYRDFEYAQQAIALDVKHYLSKPIDVSELSEMLDRMVRLIEEEKEKNSRKEDRYSRYDTLLNWAKTEMYSDILAGLLTDEQEIRKYAADTELSEEEQNACHGVVMARCDRITAFPKGRGEYYHLLSNLMREFKCIADYVTITKQENEVTMAIRFHPELSLESAKSRLAHDYEAVQKTCAETLSVQLVFETVYVCSSLFELTGYKDMLHNLQLFQMKFQELSSAVFSGNAQKADALYAGIVGYAYTLELTQTKKMLAEMFTALQKSFQGAATGSAPLRNIESLETCRSRKELQAVSDQLYAQLKEFQLFSTAGMEALTIQKAKDFVQNNYMNDIMLEDVAGHVNLSSFYFSKFFKEKTGETLTDYITQIRMHAATELFKRRRYKIYEISEMCGYKSRKYFSHAFKQYTGYTPSEYLRTLNLHTEE